MRHAHRTDADLALLAQAKDSDAEAVLVARYSELAAIIARDFPVPGQDVEDRESECLIGLLKAIRLWRPDGGASVKTLAKRAMKMRLIDLHREARQASAIPPAMRRRLDDYLAEDGLTFADVIPAADDTEREVGDRDEAERGRDAIVALQWDILERLTTGREDSEASRLVASVRRFVREMRERGRIPTDVACDLLEILGDNDQLGLFGLVMEEGDVPEAVRRVFCDYARLQWQILQDVAAGYEHSEIAARSGIETETVGIVLGAVREGVESVGRIASLA